MMNMLNLSMTNWDLSMNNKRTSLWKNLTKWDVNLTKWDDSTGALKKTLGFQNRGFGEGSKILQTWQNMRFIGFTMFYLSQFFESLVFSRKACNVNGNFFEQKVGFSESKAQKTSSFFDYNMICAYVIMSYIGIWSNPIKSLGVDSFCSRNRIHTDEIPCFFPTFGWTPIFGCCIYGFPDWISNFCLESLDIPAVQFTTSTPHCSEEISWLHSVVGWIMKFTHMLHVCWNLLLIRLRGLEFVHSECLWDPHL